MKNKIRKKLGLLMVISMLTLTSCTKAATPLLKEGVVGLENFSFELVDYSLIRSEENPIKDATNIEEMIDNSDIDSIKIGFDIGFSSSKVEVEERDTYMILTVNYILDDAITSQRDAIIPVVSITAKDDKERELILIHNSMDGLPVNLDNPVGVLIFKMYGDTESIEISFDDQAHVLKL